MLAVVAVMMAVVFTSKTSSSAGTHQASAS
jgi:hypothetical protein